MPDAPTEALSLLATQAVAKSREGGEGLLLQPYPNYLGREVIGAWRWLREYDVGVAVEMEASEAYAPLTYLQIGFAIVLLLLMFAVWLSGFLSPNALAALLRRDGRARQLGPYRLLRQIGEGAISNVYLAQHRMLKRPAAVKVLKAQTTSDEWTARFQREVQLTSLLHHPNTITIYDYGTGPNGEFYYAMEYLEGLSLADLVERYGPVPPSRTAHILRQACASLWEAHSCDLVHRDIKPQNIMLLHDSRRARLRQGPGFRSGQADFGRTDARSHRDDAPARHAALHVAGAHSRSGRCRRPRRYLRAGRRRLLHAYRQAPVRDGNRARPDLPGAAHRAPARLGVFSLRGAGGTGCADRPLCGKRPGGATAKHRRSRRRARRAAGAQAMDARPDRCLVEGTLGQRGRPWAALHGADVLKIELRTKKSQPPYSGAGFRLAA
ncbi:MAG: serine/threonine protein kinase [Sulfuritalea sp.]|nr:serine/threonine protein kinase [Sulfuritalea sp.]